MITYLHGFASGPSSRKARYLSEGFGARGVAVATPDLTPGADGFERSTPLSMLAEARAAMGDAPGPHALIGSSLGGYLSALLASGDPRVSRLVLLAPAFRLFERWSGRLTAAELEDWRARGLATHHHVTQTERRVGWPFFEAASTLPAFPVVAVPTLVIAGARDETVPLADVAAWVERTPSARLITVDDGHELGASLDLILQEAWAFLAPLHGR
ncbi:MAG: alpha/beta fold hydrolase [Anaeromyxobacter sp.]|nr:alpha/beta fold hydrolase [Anaeromyxobacter sp.]MBL0276450.1 alpha/beta fold hydrolase [Anaeromyxobacter sp.]